MADYTTELDCVRTFLLKVHTTATTKHYPAEAGSVKAITDATSEKILVHPGEIIGIEADDIYWKRYELKIETPTETLMMSAINNIIIGIRKFNKRTAITGFTYASASTMCHLKLGKGSLVKAKSNGKWRCELWLDVEWSTS